MFVTKEHQPTYQYNSNLSLLILQTQVQPWPENSYVISLAPITGTSPLRNTGGRADVRADNLEQLENLHS